MGENEMNQVLEFNRIKAQQADTKALESFVTECIRLNKEAVLNAVSVTKNVDPIYVIETFTFQIIGMILSEKDKQEILNDVIGGSLFLLKDKLVAGFKETLKI